ncbi:GlxA family transcriptional regulator [Massilia endophytica]|uniref:GlxA family transcriptional regulator n=1 Tax=Massilia endophytica TaxID=2899220 RepID=UPI001E4A3BC3|nr:GlxA family transcriptional regulator [Massilia endophytica]UGQ49138.1 GlxA family transcriptional regulator [Massilia endophytica]
MLRYNGSFPAAIVENMPHRVVIVAFPPAQMLDISGPLDVFAMANVLSRNAGQPEPYELVLAAPEAGPLATTSGVSLLATHSLHDPALTADTLLVAGGPGARQASGGGPLIDALRALCERSGRIGSICTGAFPLAATGLLDHGRATTHWAHFDEFASQFPDVELERNALFVDAGPCHSSAGISAGIDYALSLLEGDQGRALAMQVARGLVVFLKRPGGQAQFSAQLASQASASDAHRFAELTQWMADNLEADLSVERLAERMAMSPRNFARRFVEKMNMAPAKYVERLRVDAARRLLTDGNLPLARVAERCGFSSPDTMRLAFKRHIDVAPNEFRARFRSTGRSVPPPA